VIGQHRRDVVDDPRVVGAVDGDDERLALDEEHRPFAQRADGHGQVEVGLGLGQRSFEHIGRNVVRRFHQHHHREVAGQHRHGAVLQIAAHAEQHAGHRRHDAGTIGAQGPHCELVHHSRAAYALA
jgi:hypothetical protein